MTSALFLASVSEELGVGIGTLSLYFSITSIVMIFWLPYAGRLINRYDIRIVAAFAAALMALSFAGFGFLQGVYGWYLLAIPHAMGATILASLLGHIPTFGTVSGYTLKQTRVILSFSSIGNAIGSIVIGLVSSAIMVLAPVLTIQFYGQKDYEKIYAKISMGAPLASIVLIPVYGFIYERTRNYAAVLVGIAVLLLIKKTC